MFIKSKNEENLTYTRAIIHNETSSPIVVMTGEPPKSLEELVRNPIYIRSDSEETIIDGVIFVEFPCL